MISRVQLFWMVALCISVVSIGTPSSRAQQRNAGEPRISGTEPSSQKEADWVDNRWAQTEIGPFLASSMRLPGGVTIAKALTVEAGVGSVVYDTATMNLAGGWGRSVSGFLTFETGRFGLIGPPKPGGVVLKPGPVMQWPAGGARLTAIHRGEVETILDYRLRDRRVQEAGAVNVSSGGFGLIRKIDVDPGDQVLSLPALPGAVRSEVQIFGIPFTLFLESTDRGSSAVVVEGIVPTPTVPASASRTIVRLVWVPAALTAPIVKGWVADDMTAGASVRTLLEPRRSRSITERESLPGGERWLPAIETRGQLGTSTGPLAVDTLTVPYRNHWSALMFFSGVDFTSNGDCYACTIHGDVWKITGVDATLSKLTWKRFGTGLYQPLGLKVVKDQVYVLGRDRITCLKDLNGDGEADTYENFCDLIQTSTGGHDYVTSLETDSAGNFYYVDPKGAHRVSPDGRKLETIATGFRNPNGMGVRPDGAVITVAPQQGTWTPSSLIAEVKAGGYYGFGGPKITESRTLGYDAPLCWLPHGVDNSSGGQAWIPEGRWGALGGQMIHLSWGRCFPMVVLRDTAGPVVQGAAMALPAKFLSGPNRATWSERDQSLYVAGSTGWQTSAVKDGALQRIRWTGKMVAWPIGWTARKDGIELKFSAQLRRETAEDAGSYGLKWWNYRYTADYGSKDWSVAAPEREGRDEVPITSARLAPDGISVFLAIPGMRPVMQFELRWNLDEAGGKASPGTVYGTINALR